MPRWSSSRIRSRATRSATTPTRSSPATRGGGTATRPIAATRRRRPPASAISACTRACGAGRWTSASRSWPPYARVDDVAQAAKDWPQLNFVIYHAGYRLDDPDWALEEFERTGRIDWVTDLAEIPEKHGVTNVYADLGQIFAQTLIAQPRICAAITGQLVRGLGTDHVCWGTDAVWTGSPQWQIEGLRRLEIPEDMQRAHGFAPLGPADGPVKSAIFGGNSARLYGGDLASLETLNGDRFAATKREYMAAGAQPTNRRYGYVRSG